MNENDEINIISLQNYIKTTLKSLSEKYSDRNGFVPQSEIWQKVIEENETKEKPLEQHQLLNTFHSALFGSTRSFNLFEFQENEGEEISWRCRIIQKTGAFTNNSDIPSKNSQIQELQKRLRLIRTEVASLEAYNAQLTAQKENMKNQLPPETRKIFELYEATFAVIQKHNATLNNIQTSLESIVSIIPNDFT